MALNTFDSCNWAAVRVMMSCKTPATASPTRSGRGPLYTAAEKGRVRLVSLLVTLGQNVDRSDSYGITPLQIAAWNNHCEVVQKLCRHSHDVNIADKNGHTALFKAVWNGCIGCVESLLKAAALCDVADIYGNTPLMLAAELAYVQVTGRLVQAGAPINHQNWRGETALYMAAASCHVPCLQLLLEVGADPDLADTNGCTPLYCCVSHNSGPSALTSILLLIRANASLDKRGRTLEVCQGKAMTAFELGLQIGNHRVAKVLALARCNLSIMMTWAQKGGVPGSLKENQSLMECLTQLAQNTPTLRHSCRRVIRQNCSVPDISKLCLPKPILDYLNFRDLDNTAVSV